MTTRKLSIRMTQLQVVAMSKVLEEHIRLIPKANPDDPQLVEYAEGWDDERVGKAIDPQFRAVHAAHLRAGLYGRLFVKPPVRADNKRLEQLEAKLAQVAGLLADLCNKHDKLCSALSLNRVVDARHLAMNATPPRAASGDERHAAENIIPYGDVAQ